MSPSHGHGGSGNRGYGYGYPVYGLPYWDVDFYPPPVNNAQPSELQKLATKLDELTKKLGTTPISQTNLRLALNTEINQIKNQIKKLSTISNADGSTNLKKNNMSTIITPNDLKSCEKQLIDALNMQNQYRVLLAKAKMDGRRDDIANLDMKIVTIQSDINKLTVMCNQAKNSLQRSSHFSADGDSGFTFDAKTIAIPAIGGVVGFFGGKALGFNPLISAIVLAGAAFGINYVLNKNTTEPVKTNAPAFKASLKSATEQRGTTIPAATAINTQPSLSSNDVVMSSSFGFDGFSNADANTHNCPACKMGKKCDQDFDSEFCRNRKKGVTNTISANKNIVTGSGITSVVKKGIVAPHNSTLIS